MDSCCVTPTQSENINICPVCEQKGKRVPLITMKALLKAFALEQIQPELSYAFCPTPSCEVVYFTDSQTFGKDALKVSVFQKDMGLDVPVCYCFDWTRERLTQAVELNQSPIDHVGAHVRANRCGCEVNNPQGACCLGNVTSFVRSLTRS